MLASNTKQILNLASFTTSIAPKKNGCVRFVLISDTHCETEKLNLPEGDILLHAGDFTNVGRASEVEQFNSFLEGEKHKFKHIVVISGNHELTFDGSRHGSKLTLEDIDFIRSKLTNCTYIEDESLQLMGFNIFGSPWYVRKSNITTTTT